MTFQLSFYRPSPAFRYRVPWWTSSTSAFAAAGLFWGGALAFLGVSPGRAMWFVAAIFASVLAACIACYGTTRFRQVRKYKPALSATGLICITMMIANWAAGLAIRLF